MFTEYSLKFRASNIFRHYFLVLILILIYSKTLKYLNISRQIYSITNIYGRLYDHKYIQICILPKKIHLSRTGKPSTVWVIPEMAQLNMYGLSRLKGTVSDQQLPNQKPLFTSIFNQIEEINLEYEDFIPKQHCNQGLTTNPNSATKTL